MKKKDYSDFVSHLSNLSGVLSLFCGFTFTSITILMTQLPDPSSILAQFTLFFFAVLFDLFLFSLTWTTISLIQFCEYVPFNMFQHSNIFNWLLFSLFGVWGLAVVLMFLLWNLFYLALASGIVWTLLVITGFILLWKPFQEFYRKTVSSWNWKFSCPH